VAWKWDFFRFFFLNYHHPGEICKLFWFIKIFSIGWRNLNNHLSILYVDLVFLFFLNFFHPSQKMIFWAALAAALFLFWKNKKFWPGKKVVVGFWGTNASFICLFQILEYWIVSRIVFKSLRKCFSNFPFFGKMRWMKPLLFSLTKKGYITWEGIVSEHTIFKRGVKTVA